MKNKTVEQLILLIFACVISYILVVAFTAIAFSKIPTTAENEKIRDKLIDLAFFIAGAVVMSIKNKNDNKNDLGNN